MVVTKRQLFKIGIYFQLKRIRSRRFKSLYRHQGKQKYSTAILLRLCLTIIIIEGELIRYKE